MRSDLALSSREMVVPNGVSRGEGRVEGRVAPQKTLRSRLCYSHFTFGVNWAKS